MEGQPSGEVMRNGSVSLWFNTPVENQWRMFFGTMNDGATEGIWSGINRSNKLEFGLRTAEGQNIAWTYDNRKPISPDTWHFYTVTWGINEETGSLDINVYLNGELALSGTQVDMGAVDWQYPMQLGAGNSRGNAEDLFVGSLDEIAFYNYPLSHAAVIQEYVSVTGEIVSYEIVSYYPFEGTLEDMLGPYDGIMPEGEPNYVASGYDALGQALYLDGSQYLDIGEGQPSGEVMRNGSASLWFNTPVESQWRMFFGTMNDGVTEGIWSGIDRSDLTVFGLRTAEGANIAWTYDNRKPVSPDTWHYYTVTWGINEETGSLDINEYLNGELTRSGTQVDMGAVDWQYPMQLGAGNSRGNAEDLFVGSLDEIAFYNYPLSHAAVIQEYVDVIGM